MWSDKLLTVTDEPLKEDKTAIVQDTGNGNLEISFDEWTNIKQTKPWIYNTIPDIGENFTYGIIVCVHKIDRKLVYIVFFL